MLHGTIGSSVASQRPSSCSALEAQLETWDPTAMVVLVVCYLHRLARPRAVLVVVEDAQPGG